MDWLNGVSRLVTLVDRLVTELVQQHGRRAVGFEWTIRVGASTTVIRGEKIMLLLRDDQKVTLAIQPVDAKGNPAKVDGVPAWTNSDDTAGVLTVAADGLSAEFVAGMPGVTQVTVTADADLGAGVRAISGVLDIQVEPGEAVTLDIKAGVPEAQ